jgi:chitinase
MMWRCLIIGVDDMMLSMGVLYQMAAILMTGGLSTLHLRDYMVVFGNPAVVQIPANPNFLNNWNR